MHKSTKSRAQVADEMSALVGRRISVRMLDEYAREAKTRFPAALVDAFCTALGDDRLKRLVVGDSHRPLIELGEKLRVLLDAGGCELRPLARPRQKPKGSK